METTCGTVVESPEQLVAGKWYCLGLMDDEGKIDWNSAPLYRYEGDGCWSDDDGEPVERLWDPVLQAWVGMGADAYMAQC